MSPIVQHSYRGGSGSDSTHLERELGGPGEWSSRLTPPMPPVCNNSMEDPDPL